MIKIAKSQRSTVEQNSPDARFESMLPAIERHARVAFREFNAEQREELTAEVVANVFLAFRRLCERNKAGQAYPTVLANYAIRQVRQGRRVGTRMNVRDVTSPYCQRRKGVRVRRLRARYWRDDRWQDLVVEDKRSTPAEIAVMRIDFRAWLASLSSPKRRLANLLAQGEATSSAARVCGVQPSRISQLRRELEASWHVFQGEVEVESRATDRRASRGQRAST